MPQLFKMRLTKRLVTKPLTTATLGLATAVGVATGGFTVEELLAAGAHAALPDLSDTTVALDAILGPP